MVRKKIITIFGGFLAVMMVFTVLSRAVNGASMAKVETVRIKTGTIDHKVTGSGKVEAGKEIAVYTEFRTRNIARKTEKGGKFRNEIGRAHV